MDADDPRHGQYAGFMAHMTAGTDVCAECRAARLRYNKALRLDHLRGNRRTLPILGSRRRLQALAAIGYSHAALARYLGVTKQRVYQWTSVERYQRIYPATALQISELYERLCMTPQIGGMANRIKNQAKAKGWAPPLAWDDIDNDLEPPRATPTVSHEDSIDHAVVQRVIDNSGRTRKLTRAESAECVRLLLRSGLSARRIENEYGFKVDRYWKAAA